MSVVRHPRREPEPPPDLVAAVASALAQALVAQFQADPEAMVNSSPGLRQQVSDSKEEEDGDHL